MHETQRRAAERRQGRRYRGVAAAERRQERRDRLVETGLEIFGTVGYRAGTVDMVCEAAGLTKRYFYESFASREDLFIEVYISANARLLKAVAEAAAQAGPDPMALAHDCLNVVFSTFDQDQRLARVMYIEVLGVSPAVDLAYWQAIGDWSTTIADLFPDLATGARRDLLATAALGAVTGVAMRWAIGGYTDPVDDLVAAVEALLSGILDNPAPGA